MPLPPFVPVPLRRLALATAIALPAVAGATVPDVYGLGARSMGMGGGGIALVDDGPSAMINPAGLSRMRQPSAGIGLSAAIERFADVPPLWWDTNRDGSIDANDPPLDYDAGVDDAIGAHFFFGRHVGQKFGLGIAGYVPVNRLLRFETFEPSLPTYFMYDNRTQRYSLAASVGGRIVKGVHVGLGVDFVPRARLELVMTAEAAFVGDGEGGSANDVVGDVVIDVHELSLDLVPGFAPLIGLQLEFGAWVPALDGLLIAGTYRGEVGLPIEVNLDAQVDLSVTDVGDLDPFVTALVVDAGLMVFDHFVPRTATGGVGWRAERWGLYGDVKWTDWSRMVLNVTRLTRAEVSAPLVQIPEDAIRDGNAFDVTFVDTVSFKVGGEWVVHHAEVPSKFQYWKVRVRAGAGWEPTPLVAQGAGSTLLDADRAWGTLGAGVETMDPFDLVAAPVRLDAFAQFHALPGGSVARSAAEPTAGYVREGTDVPYGGAIGVFGVQFGMDYH